MHEDPRSNQRPGMNREREFSDTGSDDEDYDAAPRPETSLLSGHRITGHPEQGSHEYHLTRKGKLRPYWLGIVVCMGGFLRT
jgi:hypothetical protein